MKQKVNPVVAGILILCTIALAGYFIWYGNRDRPIPDEFIAPSQGQAMMAGKMGAPGMPGGKKPSAPAPRPAPAADKAAANKGAADAKDKTEDASSAPSGEKPADKSGR